MPLIGENDNENEWGRAGHDNDTWRHTQARTPLLYIIHWDNTLSDQMSGYGKATDCKCWVKLVTSHIYQILSSISLAGVFCLLSLKSQNISKLHHAFKLLLLFLEKKILIQKIVLGFRNWFINLLNINEKNTL